MLINDLTKELTQDVEAGGANTPPEARLFLYSLAKMIRAKDILETGYDAGYTTLALAMTGAHVDAIDNLSEYDFIFIDDCHDLEHVKKELEQIGRILRPGGIVAFHDTIKAGIGKELPNYFKDWNYMQYLHCYSPYEEHLNGTPHNYGIGIVQKPYDINKEK